MSSTDGVFDAAEFVAALRLLRDGAAVRSERMEATRALESALAGDECIRAYLEVESDAENVVDLALADGKTGSLTRTHLALAVLRRCVSLSPRVARDLVKSNARKLWALVAAPAAAPSSATRRTAALALGLLTEAVSAHGPALARDVLIKFDWGLPRHAKALASPRLGVPDAAALLIAAILNCADRELYALVFGRKTRAVVIAILQLVVDSPAQPPSESAMQMVHAIYLVSKDPAAQLPRLLATVRQIPQLLLSIALNFIDGVPKELHHILLQLVQDADTTSPLALVNMIYAPGSSTKLRPFVGANLSVLIELLTARPETVPLFLSRGLGHNEPTLSTQWLSVAAVAMESLALNPVATDPHQNSDETVADLVIPAEFTQHGFLDKALVHDAPLVKYTGLLVYRRIVSRLRKVSDDFSRAGIVQIVLSRLPSVDIVFNIVRQEKIDPMTRAIAVHLITFFHQHAPRTIAQNQLDIPKVVLPQLHKPSAIESEVLRHHWRVLALEVVSVAPAALLVSGNGLSISRFGRLLADYLENSVQDVSDRALLVCGMQRCGLFLRATVWEAEFWIDQLWKHTDANRGTANIAETAREIDTILVDAHLKPFTLVDKLNNADMSQCSLFTAATLFRARRRVASAITPGWACIQDTLIKLRQLHGPCCVPLFQLLLGEEALPELLKSMNGDHATLTIMQDSDLESAAHIEISIRSTLSWLRRSSGDIEVLRRLALLCESSMVDARVLAHVLEDQVIRDLLVKSTESSCAIVSIAQQLLGRFPSAPRDITGPCLTFISRGLLSSNPLEGLYLAKLLADSPLPCDIASRLLALCAYLFRSSTDSETIAHAADVSIALLKYTDTLDPQFLLDLVQEILPNPASELDPLIISLFSGTGKTLVEACSVAALQGVADDFVTNCFLHPQVHYSRRLAFLLRQVDGFAGKVAPWLEAMPGSEAKIVSVGSALSDRQRTLFELHLPILEAWCSTLAPHPAARVSKRRSFLEKTCLVPLLELEKSTDLMDDTGTALLAHCLAEFGDQDTLTVYLVAGWKTKVRPVEFRAEFIPPRFLTSSESADPVQGGCQTYSGSDHIGKLITVLRPKSVKVLVHLANFVMKKKLWVAAPSIFDQVMVALQSAPQLGNVVKGGIGKDPDRCRSFAKSALKHGSLAESEVQAGALHALRLLTKLVFKSCLPPSELLSLVAKMSPRIPLTDADVTEEFAQLVATVIKRADKDASPSDLKNMRPILKIIADSYPGTKTSTSRALKRAADTFLIFEDKLRDLGGNTPYVGYLDLDPRAALYSFDHALIRSTADGVLNSSDNVLDPLLVVTMGYRLVCQALRDDSCVVDLRRCVTSGSLGVSLASVSSPNLHLRTMAYGFLEGFGQLLGNYVAEPGYADLSVSAALFKDRRQVLYLLLAFRDWMREPLQQVSHIACTFLRLTLMILMQPTHDLYLPLTRLLVKKDLEWFMNGGFLVHFLKDPRGHRGGILFALRTINLGCKSKDDLLLLRKKRALALMVPIVTNSYDSTLSRMSMEAFLSISRFSAGARELRRRHDVLRWVTTVSLDERDRGLSFELYANVCRQVFRDKEVLECGKVCREVLTRLLIRFGESLFTSTSACHGVSSHSIFRAVEMAVALSPRKRHLLQLPRETLERLMAFATAPHQRLRLMAYAVQVPEESGDSYYRECWIAECLQAVRQQAIPGSGSKEFPVTRLDRDVLLTTAYEYLSCADRATVSGPLRHEIAKCFMKRDRFSLGLMNYCALSCLVKSGSRRLTGQLVTPSIKEKLEQCAAPPAGMIETVESVDVASSVHAELAEWLPAALLGVAIGSAGRRGKTSKRKLCSEEGNRESRGNDKRRQTKRQES